MADPFADIDDTELLRKYGVASELARNGDAKAESHARAMGDVLRMRRDGGVPASDMGDGSMAAPHDSAGAAFVNSATEGLISGIPGGLVDGLTALINSPQSLSNLIGKGVNKVTGEDTMRTDYPPFIEDPFGGSESIKRGLRTDIMPDTLPTSMIPGIEEDYQVPIDSITYEPTGAHPLAEKAGDFVGEGGALLTGTGVLGAATRAGKATTGSKLADDIAGDVSEAIAKNPKTVIGTDIASNAIAAPGGELGANIGRAADDFTGLEGVFEPTGETLGTLLAGASPSGAITATRKGAQRVLADPKEGPTVTAAAQALDVPNSYGLSGSETAATMENTSGINIMAPGVRRIQQEQLDATANAAAKISDDIRGPDSTQTMATNPYQAGENVRLAGEDALQRGRERQGELSDQEMDALGGPNTGIAVDKAQGVLASEYKKATPTTRAAIADRQQELESMRTVPKDRSLDVQLRKRLVAQENAQKARQKNLKVIDTAIKNGTATPAQRKQAANLRQRLKGYDQGIASTKVQIDKNLGVANERLNNFRREVGDEIPSTGGKVGSTTTKKIYGGIRGDQRLAADARGTGTEFQAVTKEKHLLAGKNHLEEGGDLDFLSKLVAKADGTPKEPQQVYEYLASKNGHGRLMAFQRNATPQQWDDTRAAIFDLLGRPTSAHQRNSAGGDQDAWNPTAFASKFYNLPDATKQLLFKDPAIRKRIDDLDTLAKALNRRGKHANPSGTAKTAIMAAQLAGGPAGLAGGLSMMDMGTTIAAMGVGGWASSQLMRPGMARAIAGNDEALYKRMTELFNAVRAANAGKQTQKKEGPQ